ncbi:hypothetical protein HO133_001875 [Letharia lupina]|uniref:Uncharacterized protein n=1 Tax=Letharia lupina TaxID=560253 RepID=A0A8H6CEC4_9LECA|nr:uncharacterized protein HO133_001875 [Letharia lupina]KAF6221907.1 hypothetical protein HO133_001875 [Letharia lupina]
MAENMQFGDRTLFLPDLQQQRHRFLSRRAAQTYRCADLAWFEIRHLQKTFGLTDVLILQEFDDDSCVISSHQGVARMMTFDATRAELVALGKDEEGCLVNVQRRGAVNEVKKPV